MAWQSISPEVTVKGFKKCCIYPMQGMRMTTMCCGMAVKKKMEMLGVVVWKMKALTMKMETVTLTGNG